MLTDVVAVRLLQLWVVAVFLAPTDMVLRPLGGQAHLANLIGVALGAMWVAAALTPRLRSVASPAATWRPAGVHLAVALVWTATLGAWVALARRGADETVWNGADRWLMTLTAFSGVALVAADGLRRTEQVHRLMATAVAAGAVSSVVALVQWRTSLDPSVWLRRLPGFTLTGDGTATVLIRGAVGRVTGTALHPIEFGVGAALLLPLGLHLVLHDHRRRLARRLVPLLLCAVAIPLSVSRSSVVVVAVAVGVMVWFMPPAPRLTALATAPLVTGALLLAAPGTASTLVTSFLSAGDDTSIQSRLDDVTLVGQLVGAHPWWGAGAGTYQPGDVFEILDNQYFLTLVELGLVGGAVFACGALLVPLQLAGRLRRHPTDAVWRSVGAAGTATTLAAAVAWATFDAWAFPRFVALGALMLGVLGAARRLSTASPPPGSASPHPHPTRQPQEHISWTC